MQQQYQQPYQQPMPPAAQGPFGLDPKVAALLTYLPIAAIGLIASIVFFVTEKNNRFVRFHALQSLILHGSLIITSTVIGVVMTMFAVIFSRLGSLGVLVIGLFYLFLMLFGFLFLGLAVFMMIKAYNGQMFKLPIIGNIAEKNS